MREFFYGDSGIVTICLGSYVFIQDKPILLIINGVFYLTTLGKHKLGNSQIGETITLREGEYTQEVMGLRRRI